MARYLFQIDQIVSLGGAKFLSAATGEYRVIRQLPPRDGQNTYRIKSALETHERVARESDLTDSAENGQQPN